MRSVIRGILLRMVDETFPWRLLEMSTRPSRAHEVAHDRADHGAGSADPLSIPEQLRPFCDAAVLSLGNEAMRCVE
jgi:hypothetical protein